LIAYGTGPIEQYRQAAGYMERVLRIIGDPRQSGGMNKNELFVISAGQVKSDP